MKRALALAALPLVWLSTVALLGPSAPQATPNPSPSSTATPTPEPTPTPTPQPTPTPPHGSIGLSAAAGAAGTKLVVMGNGFLPNESIAFFLDSPDHPLGSGTIADQQGHFQQEVTVPDGTAAGGHTICVQQQPQPRCAQFQVQAAEATPSQAPTPTPTATPSPTPSAAAVVPTPPRRTSAVSAFLLSPFGIILVLLLIAAAAASIWWIIRSRRQRGPASVFPAATVRHATGGPTRTPPGMPPGDAVRPPMGPTRPPGAPPRPAGQAGQPRPVPPPPPPGRWAPPPPPRQGPRPAGGDDAVDMPEPGE